MEEKLENFFICHSDIKFSDLKQKQGFMFVLFFNEKESIKRLIE